MTAPIRDGIVVRFAARYALRTLIREKWRLVVVLLCIACGVASFTALQLLAASIRASTLPDPRARLGGDLMATLPDHSAIPRERIDALRRLATARGIVVSPRASAPVALVRSKNSGRIAFLSNATAVDPEAFPATGMLRIGGGGDPAIVLRRGEALITSDIAGKLDLSVGDPIVLGGGEAAAFVLPVGAIVEMTPDRRGLGVFYSIDLARRTAPAAYSRITQVLLADRIAGSGASAAFAGHLRSTGWAVESPAAPREDSTGRIIDMGLRGAGLLALIVAMIGVVISVRLFMARRRTEFAILTALGYQPRDILIITSIEASLLGGIGALTGLFAGISLAGWLVSRLAATGLVFLIDLDIGFGALALSWGLGVAVTICACNWAALVAADRWPAHVFRLGVGSIASARQASRAYRHLWPLWAITLGICIAALGGNPAALGTVVAGLALLLVAVAAFVPVLWGLAKLPFPPARALKMAQANLTRRKWNTATALTALAIGLFTIHLATTAWWSSYDRLAQRDRTADGSQSRIQMIVERRNGDESAAALLRAFGGRLHSSDMRLILPGMLSVDGNHAPVRAVLTASLKGGAASATVAYRPHTGPERIRALLSGEHGTLIVDGQAIDFTSSANRPAGPSDPTIPASAMVVALPLEQLLAAGSATTLTIVSTPEDPADADRLVGDMAHAFPDAIVFGDTDVREAAAGIYRGLFALAGALASLAVLVGLALLTNAVALATHERAAEHALYRALGYSRRQVLSIISTEFGLFGLVGGAVAVGAAAVAMTLVNMAEPAARLHAPVWQAPLLILLSTAVSALIAAAIAALALRTPPIVALRAG